MEWHLGVYQHDNFKPNESAQKTLVIQTRRHLVEPSRTRTSSGRLDFHVFGALAEFERNLVVERTRAGLDAAKARGRVGRRRVALDANAITVAGALLRDPSIQIREVAKRVGVSRATLYSYFPGGRLGVLASEEEWASS